MELNDARVGVMEIKQRKSSGFWGQNDERVWVLGVKRCKIRGSNR